MPLKIAVIGTGPSGIYVAEGIKKKLPDAEIDLIDRLPTPYGLVRFGVAPDHQGAKKVTNQYDKFLSQNGVRLLGNIEVGKDVTLPELRDLYDGVVIATGARKDKKMGIPGEELSGVIGSATFVNWYNSHPDFAELSPIPEHAKAVVVIGNGNVAIDIARVLVKSETEMADSDLAAHSRKAIDAAAIKDVTIAGRRGPAEASFTPPELRELGRLEEARPIVEGAVIPTELPNYIDQGLPTARIKTKILDIFRSFEGLDNKDLPKTIHLQFQASPIALIGDTFVTAVRFERMQMDGAGKPQGTGETFEVPADLVVSAIGYQSIPLADAPFDEKLGRFPNQDGHIEGNLFVVGWGKRGPSGTIPTNRPDSFVVSTLLMEKIVADKNKSGPSGLDHILSKRGCRPTSYADWKTIDAQEQSETRRHKICSIQEMLDCL